MTKNGVPYDEAMNLDQATRMAYIVIFGEFEGQEFDWIGLRWRKRDGSS